jgi:hypothetical protein
MRTRTSQTNNESGVALLSAILILALMSALLVGFIATVNSDQLASGVNRDQTQAYAAAHAGVEKLTADLGQLFTTNFAPTNAQVNALSTGAMEPPINGIQYLSPNNTSGYRIAFTDELGPNGLPPADGRPDLEDWEGSDITSGDYEGLTGLITPYQIEVTARTQGNAEVRMRRTLQTVGIPAFQFGIFSENDLSFFAGPNFAFGGRVHTNQNLFLKQDSPNIPNVLTLQDRVSAVGEIIRAELANGVPGTHMSQVRMALAAGCPAAPAAINASCRNLAANEGSVVGGPTSAPNEPAWTNLSIGTYNGWIRNGRTGARRLDLPVVSDGARPVDLIRRPPAGELATSPVGSQRFYNMATLRILMSDTRAEITNLPGVVGVPIALQGVLTVTAAENNVSPANVLPAGNHPFAATPAGLTAQQLLERGYRTTPGTSSIGGFVLINRQDRDGNWTDVTKEILNLGFAGKRLSDGTTPAGATTWMPNWNNNCVAPHRNAVIRVQRYKDEQPAMPCAAAAPDMNAGNYWPNVLYDPREGMLRDNENGRPVANPAPANIALNSPRLYWAGVMHYAELDVNNLRRWLDGEFGGVNVPGCANGAGPATCPMDVTGFVVYFSDRRTNKGTGNDGAPDTAATVTNVAGGVEVTYDDDAETGELGFEDNINLNANSQPNQGLDHQYTDVDGNTRRSEDLNWEPPTVLPANAPGRGTLQNYGQWARLLPAVAVGITTPANRMLTVNDGAATWADNLTPFGAPTSGLNGNYSLVGANGAFGVPIDRNTARVNRAFFFRRALKLVNGGLMELPRNGSQGLTVAAENPVYIEGNYNACSPNINQATGQSISSAANAIPFQPPCVGNVGFGANPGVDHVSAAVIADSVTFLSNAWNDIRSFINPHDAGQAATLPYSNDDADARQATTTWYRLGVISGKGLNFPRGNTTFQIATDGADWGTDGGAHNFLRYIENWGGAVQQTLNYRGSILSFYTNRQAVGVYKCCSLVYSPPARGFNFDAEFLTPSLLPPRTPMFRTVNTLTFRQVLRPTQ